MDGVAAEQRERLENIEAELIEVRRRLDRVWHVIENSELDISDATSRIREHQERQEKLEIASEEARALLSERRAVLDNVDTIAAFAEDYVPPPRARRDCYFCTPEPCKFGPSTSTDHEEGETS